MDTAATVQAGSPTDLQTSSEIPIMDNSGRGKLKVPGFEDLPQQFELPAESRFAHGFGDWRQLMPITEHELQMVRVMNLITDMPDWHVKIFDDSVVTALREPTRTMYPLISNSGWEWCVRELRDKASDFDQRGFIRVLDTGSVVCKADNLVPQDLITALASLTQKLLSKAKHRPDAVQFEVVDPQADPLVFGRTPVLRNGGTTSLHSLFGAFNSRSTCENIETDPDYRHDWSHAMNEVRAGNMREDFFRRQDFFRRPHVVPRDIFKKGRFKNYFTSPHFQRLPCDVKFGEHGVQIISYVNNLHPKNALAYKSIEDLICLALEPWNACLVKGRHLSRNVRRHAFCSGRPQCGPVPSRIPTYGRDWICELPFLALVFNPDYPAKSISDMAEARRARRARRHWPGRRTSRGMPQCFEEIDDGLRPFTEPAPSPALAEALKWAESFLQLPNEGEEPTSLCPLPEDWLSNTWQRITEKALARRDYVGHHPKRAQEPGISLSYEEWSSGVLNSPWMSTMFIHPSPELRPCMGSPSWLPSGDQDWTRAAPQRLAGLYYRGPTLERYTVRLQDEFSGSGLQIMVKISGIELTPQNPHYGREEWHVQGFLNEHIAATAIAVIDADNITACCAEFRQDTPPPFGDIGGEGWEWWESFPWDALNPSMSMEPERGLLTAQFIGKVDLRVGRMVAFPNVMEHRLGSFQLLDHSRGGHIRFVTLELVDPNYRICSTRNVPAQQYEWWAEPVTEILQQNGLPSELCELITSFCRDPEHALQDKRDIQDEIQLLDTARYWMLRGLHDYSSDD